ncbi:hypothetical protein BBI15_11505 [Planococcus plakortidis]|uniref:Uncharacterized protein n=1 Tax=Planococcus plakortidis TaxID=1038856 RepID=A0A1C7EAT0_9BACL|nr:hypothetical protein BBI15_11505 [Planococcus plakortidis]
MSRFPRCAQSRVSIVSLILPESPLSLPSASGMNKKFRDAVDSSGRFQAHRMWVMQLARQDIAVSAAEGIG